jgi:hypothetical protein
MILPLLHMGSADCLVLHQKSFNGRYGFGSGVLCTLRPKYQPGGIRYSVGDCARLIKLRQRCLRLEGRSIGVNPFIHLPGLGSAGEEHCLNLQIQGCRVLGFSLIDNGNLSAVGKLYAVDAFVPDFVRQF